MRNSVLLSLLISLATSTLAAADGTPFTVPICSGPGSKCDTTCKLLGICLSLGNGYQWSQVKDCGREDKFCNAGLNSCSDDINECVKFEYEIACGSDGNFPDPFDCKKYYTCVAGATPTPVSCIAKHGYDACTGKCDVVLSNDVCPTAQEYCHAAGEIGVVEQNSRLFYLCQEDVEGNLIPKMFTCDDGFFDTDSKQCSPSSEPGCRPSGCRNSHLPDGHTHS